MIAGARCTLADNTPLWIYFWLVASTVLPDRQPAPPGTMATDRRAAAPRLSPGAHEVLLEWFRCEPKDIVAQKLRALSRIGGKGDWLGTLGVCHRRPMPARA